MPGIKIGLLDGLTAKMKHLDRRQQVVASNIANADTPDYRGRDLEKPDFSKVLGEVGDRKIHRPRVTATSKMAALGSRVGVGARTTFNENTEVKLNGNNVTVEDEMLKLGDIRQDYSAASNLYRKSLGLLKIATVGRSN